MKDDSRAKWPEGMKQIDQDSLDGEKWSVVCCLDEIGEPKPAVAHLFGPDKLVDARFVQICALPKMVALLKGIAETYMAYKGVDIDFQLDDYYKEAYDICKSIGEVE